MPRRRAARYLRRAGGLAAGSGPSVSPAPGVAPRSRQQKFMVSVTGMREPQSEINYYVHVAEADDGKPKARTLLVHGIRAIRRRRFRCFLPCRHLRDMLKKAR